MSFFVDEVRFQVVSGDGGAGAVSFRREKYVPYGGPDGGDGGKGGNVVFESKSNLSTLSHLKGKPVLRARKGQDGRGRRMHGRNGDDLLIHVPPGTRIKDSDTGECLHDFSNKTDGEQWICLVGGRGGQGNWHFRSSRNHVPRFAQPGMPGTECGLDLELSVIADVGLLGLPNAGKSSLINAVTATQSKVGAYPFTTRIPHLGVYRRGDKEIILADIPGLVEGASSGYGMGFQFLRHVGRAKKLAWLTDLGEKNPADAVRTLEKEIRAYDPSMANKKRVIIGTKTDLDMDGEKMKSLQAAFPNDMVMGISVFTRTGLEAIMDTLLEN